MGLNTKKESKKPMNRLKQGLSWLIFFSMILSVFHVNTVLNLGAGPIIDWRKNDVMDINLNIINNKAGADDVFFEMDLEDAGTYVFDYYLEEGRKTTVSFVNNFEQLDISFKVQEYDPLNPGTPIEITQDLIDLSYLEIDYDQQVPSWQFISDKEVDPVTETLDFTIERSASARYPGIAFQMDNKKFIVKWDFQDDMLYILFDQYENGFIMPVTMTNPDTDSQTIKVLKGLEDFVVEPTYLIEDPDNPGTNIQVSPVTHPNANNDKPGNRPGLRYNFKQPRELNPATWGYQYDLTDLSDIRAVFEVSDIGSSDYLDFNMLLQDGADTRIYEIPSENGDQAVPANQVNYAYDGGTYEYEILIVQDKSDLAVPETIIQWDDIQSSRIYNTSIGFQFENPMPEYEFATFTPESNFAYTFLEYQLRRSDQQEAYLEIVPYQTGSQDEIEYVVLYSKIIAAELDPVNDLWLKHYQTDGDDSSTINIPVPFRADSFQDAYQIIVNFSNTELMSQVLNYRAIDDLNVPPTTPSIVGIENLYVVPPEDELDENPTKIQFDLIWDAIENRAVKELDDIFADEDGLDNDYVYYEVLVNDIPDLNEDNPFEVFRVYRLYQDDGDGLYKLEEYPGITADDQESSSTNYVVGYNDVDELLRMEKIVIYEDDLWTSRIDTVYDEDLDTYTVTERTNVSHPTSFETNMEFPGVNYVRIRAITEKDGILGVSNYSIPVSLSLSMLRYEIPIVEGITYEPFYSLIDTDPMGITLDWPAIDISTYENNMLFPVDKQATGITYSVYISEDKDSLLHLKDSNDDYTEIVPGAGGDVVIDGATLAYLRDEDVDGKGNVIYFDVDKTPDSTQALSHVIEGLDLNANYYIRIVVSVDIEHIITSANETRRGEPSSLISVTTPVVPPEPGEDDIIPLAPENLLIEFLDDSQISTTLEWVIPEAITIEEDTFGFEIFSIEDLRLPDALDNKDVQILDILGDETLEDREMEAWRIFYEGADIVLKKYNEETDTWDTLGFDLLQASDAGMRMIDDSNSPNRVNYYYVRTINIKSGVPIRMSSWLLGSITTSPVKGPINLSVDYDTELTFDPKYETIIQFDAPIPDTAIIDTEYVMEVFVKGDADLDYVKSTRITSPRNDDDTYYSQLMDEDPGPVGYKRLFYRISGLQSGKQYSIKVRIEDRTKQIEILPDGSEAYPVSPFSESVMTRTEFDQEDYDKERKYVQYIDYYLKQAESLKQKPYFVIGETEDSKKLKYRLDYVDGFLQLAKNDEYELASFDVESVIYYIPSEMIESGNDLNVTYILEPYTQQIGISPYALGTVITEEINTVVNLINDYDATLEDYYIRVQVMAGDFNGSINGSDPGSQLVNITMDVIGSSDIEDNIDLYVENELDLAIGRGKDELVTLLDEELERGINDVILTGIVEEVIDGVSEDFALQGNNVFTSYLDTTSYPIEELDKDMTIGLSPFDESQSLSVYKKTNAGWEDASSQYYDGRYQIYTKDLGSFVGITLIDAGDLALYYNEDQVGIINKYRLHEVFTTFEFKNPDDLITNMQMIQTLARLTGANEDYDDKDYLRGQGIDVPPISEFGIATKEMANYLYVQVYTDKNQMDLAAVMILDYNAIEDINSVNSAYRDTLLKGVSLTIIELNNGYLQPADQVSIETFLGIIENIEQ